MKKALLLFALASSFVVGLQHIGTAQVCTPDSAYTQSGIWPDSATGFAPAIQCTYYEQLITAIVPADTATGTIAGTCNIDSVVLDALVGLPPGLTYTCNIPTCSFVGGTTDCGIIYGTPTDTGTFPLIATTTSYVSGGFLNLCNGQSIVTDITYYYIVVTSPITFTSSGPCGGSCDGQITASVNGPPSPYNFMWDDAQTTSTATGLCSGSHSVSVTDSAGCVSADSVSISASPAIVVVAGSIDASCVGSNDGVASVVVSGGVGLYTYLWDDLSAQTTDTAFGLGPGSYSVVVTDSAGCKDSASVVISEPPLLTVYISGSSNVTCNGDCDGEAIATAGGGTAPYTYSWDDPGAQVNDTATGLCASTVIVTVEDSNTCTATDTIAITQPFALSVGIGSTTDADCNGNCNGTATGAVIGGTGPYTYLWDDTGAQTTIVATGLCADNYRLLVTDSSGCTDTAIAVVGEPAELVVSIVGSNNVTCNGACDGDATGAASGGTLPYTYLWDDPGAETNLSVTNLCADSFNFEVTDGNGCIDSAKAAITEPSAVVATITDSSNASCSGECDGTATVSSSGGGGPYGYSWDDLLSQATAIADSLCAGPYSVVVTDTSGCTDTASVVITEPSVITLVMGSTDVSCGASNGTASVSASGGAGNYAYLWDDPGAQTTDTATALNAGGYMVAVTDASGCSEIGVISVNNTGAATVSITSITNVTCAGANDGAAVVLATGGTLPYMYSWDDPGTQSTDTATGLAGGTYVATVTDGAGCIASDIAVVLEPAALSLSTGTSDASCAGVCDGTAMVTASGGTGAYTYLWDDSNAQTIATADSLCAGGYNVMVTDSNGCQNAASATVVEPAALMIGATSSSPNCAGVCDGAANAVVGGGTPTYTYLWTDSIGDTLAMGGSIGGLCAGNYGLTATDGNGCSAATVFTLSDPVSMVLSLSSATASCGAANGSASVTVTNGILPYTYLWDDPGAQTTDTASALSAGTYTVDVTDSIGCIASGSTTVGNSGSPTVSISSNDASCNGFCDGSAVATVTGGIGRYTYLWDDPAATSNLTVTGLCAGSYTFMVIDSLGCIAFGYDTILEPSALVLFASGTDASCNGSCDGTATIVVSGGASPYGYLWDDPSAQTLMTADSLCAGTHNVVVTDSNGCADTANVVINAPSAILLTMSSTDASCGVSNGSASVSASGGAGSYAYLWDDPGAQTTDTATALSAGGYTVVVTDTSGCSEVGVVSVNNTGAAAVSITSITNVTCAGANDGSAVVLATGGTLPYVYSWDDPGTQSTDTATGLAGGTYVATVTDGVGCIASDIAVVLEPAALSLSTGTSDASCAGVCDGSATVTATGGTGSYTYLWDDPKGQSTATADSLCAGGYNVMVTDSNGCQDSDSVTVQEPSGLTTTVSTTAPTCIGSCDGTAMVVAAGGTLQYTYLWTDSIGDTLAVGDSISGLCAGGYGLVITDGNGCISVSPVTLMDPIGMTLTFASTPSTCGASDGSASVSVANGTAPYAYLWDDPAAQTTDTASALLAGVYNVSVTDGNGCMETGNVLVSALIPPGVTLTATDATCNGEATGTATATIVGGSMPYTYSWDDASSQTASGATGLTAGTYSVTVTDNNGCTDTASIVVGEPGAIVIGTETATDPSCYGAADGAITIVASGGTGSLTYSIDGGVTYAGSGTFTGLGGGTYNVTVMDSAGCMVSGSALTLTEPPALIIDSVVVTDISCNGLTDASVVVYASGGTGALEYSIDSGATYTNTSGSFTGLGALTIIVAVRDSSMCEVIGGTYTITEPAELLVSTSSTMETGVGNADGTATAIVSGGTSPYNYSWNSSPVQTGAVATGLSTGDYAVQITDANGCTTSDTVNVGLSIGIDHITQNLTVKLYPNPAQTELSIELNVSDNFSFIVYDVTGKQVLAQEIESMTSKFSITNLSTGLYVYRVYNASGAALSHGKFNILK